MIALETNVLVRLVVEDDQGQAAKARRVIEKAEGQGEKALLLAAVLLETVLDPLQRLWFFKAATSPDFWTSFCRHLPIVIENRNAVQRASLRYRVYGDFTDLLFVE